MRGSGLFNRNMRLGVRQRNAGRQAQQREARVFQRGGVADGCARIGGGLALRLAVVPQNGVDAGFLSGLVNGHARFAEADDINRLAVQ
jgi:hypothetical protein